MNFNTKQVIVVRNDLNMRKGKIASQASHASMSFLTRNGYVEPLYGVENVYKFSNVVGYSKQFSEEIDHWLRNSFKKIVVYVNSEKELEDLHDTAIRVGLISHLIIDSGKTEFNGIYTPTCLAIGPHYEEKFVGVTDHLPLL